MRLYLSSFRLGNHPEEFVRLLRGQRRVGVIMNAVDFLNTEQRKENLAQELERLKVLDLDYAEIDLRAYFGQPQQVEARLQACDALWVRGGNSFVLRRAFRQSGADEAIRRLLAEDALVYAGYSAGIDMLVPSLHGIELVDDPNTVPAGYDPAILWDALGILTYAIAPHYKSDHPESAAVDNSVAYMIDNHIPFIALRDGQAIVVDGDRQKVVG